MHGVHATTVAPAYDLTALWFCGIIADSMTTPLQKARKAAGLTQTELAKLAGTDQSQISRAERGRVSVELAASIAAVLPISEVEILYPERFTEAA